MIKYPVTVEQTEGPYSVLRDADGRAIAGGISKADAADLFKLATVYEKALAVFAAYADGNGRSQAEALRDLILAVGDTLAANGARASRRGVAFAETPQASHETRTNGRDTKSLRRYRPRSNGHNLRSL